MKILSIDTSSKICGVTISENEKILIHLHNDDERTHSVKLMPMIDKALKNTKLTLDDIALFAVCIGPGSFTGVRIGIATIKAFADVKKIPVVGVSSLESLAYNVLDNINIENTVVCSLIDAKNSNVYCGIYKFCKSDATLKCEGLDIFAEDIDTTINKIQKFSKYNIMFVGDGATNYLEKIKQNFPEAKFANFESSGFSASADTDLNLQNSNSIARAALSKYMQGQIGDSTSISPIYLKKSQAERALEEKIQIAPMSKEDIEAISPNFQDEFDKFWNIQNLKSDFENSNSTYYIAKLDNEIVGFAGFLKICDEANLMNIVTKTSKRHLGIGTKLLEAIIKEAKKQNLKTITLEVNEKNTYAIDLYEKKFNFKRIGLRKKYYNNTDDAILMSMGI